MTNVTHQPRLPEPWHLPRPPQAAGLEHEASLEVGPGHELAGHTLTAIAKYAACDEVLFQLEDATYAVLHLTWAQHPEPSPWPSTRLGI